MNLLIRPCIVDDNCIIIYKATPFRRVVVKFKDTGYAVMRNPWFFRPLKWVFTRAVTGHLVFEITLLNGTPITITKLDPVLGEFLPQDVLVFKSSKLYTHFTLTAIMRHSR